MASFDDWLTVTDPKVVAETLAEQFRLSPKELQKASEALAPAFALGFQRAMADPAAWTDLSSAFWGMVPGFQAAGRPASGTLPGELLTRTFFGSDALAGAVARHASLFAGIAPDTVQKLMPGLAMLTVQAMVRSAMETMGRSGPAGLASGDLGGATAEMMRRGANAVEALSRPSDAAPARKALPYALPGPAMADVFAEALKASLAWMQPGAGAAPRRAEPERAAPAAAQIPMAPFAAMFDAFAKGMQSAAAGGDAAPPVQREPVPPPPPPEGEAGLVGGMMRSGQALHDGYAREMAALFDRYGRDGKAG